MGRPAGFDRTLVLETIQDQFWNNGYSATSLDDIVNSTGLGKGSLYGAFGAKHEMYLAAFRDYCDDVIKIYADRLRGADDGALERLRKLVRWAAKCTPGARRGCMLAKGNAELSGRFDDVDAIIAKTFKALEGELLGCIRQAQCVGEIDRRCDAPTIAFTLFVLLRGMEALKRSGAPAASLALAAKGANALFTPPKPKRKNS